MSDKACSEQLPRQKTCPKCGAVPTGLRWFDKLDTPRGEVRDSVQVSCYCGYEWWEAPLDADSWRRGLTEKQKHFDFDQVVDDPKGVVEEMTRERGTEVE